MNLRQTPIRDLGLAIEGTSLAPTIARFDRELDAIGLSRLRPRYYLSTEWGVPTDSLAIAMPFYLARPELTAIHAERTGFVEGSNAEDILRYLRHEMGHVVNYAYRLYEEEGWVARFGSMTQPYLEEYRPQAFSKRYVRHLPGWYAQKHPDEDWSETFAVWMTPGADWRAEYASWPVALDKLEYCDRAMRSITGRSPLSLSGDLHEDVSQIGESIDDFYATVHPASEPIASAMPPGLDGALCVLFEDAPAEEEGDRLPASALVRELKPDLLRHVFRWTGHFPERTSVLIDFLAARADALRQVYSPRNKPRLIVGLTALITALAMNYVHRGDYGE